MESKKHIKLVEELFGKIKDWGYRIDGADLDNQNQPEIVDNKDNVGDGENKIPDILAYDESKNRVIRGEAKTGEGDIETEHSITQYLLFSNRSKNRVASWLYVMVPKNNKDFLNEVIIKNIPQTQWENIRLIASENY